MQGVVAKERCCEDEEIAKIATDFIRFSYRDFMSHRIIFSHEFAKAFFGEGFRHREKGRIFNEWEWEWQLQQMVISEDPIMYLEQFLK